MITLVLFWVQAQVGHASGFSFTGDEFRTWLMGVLTALVAALLKTAISMLKVGYAVRDDVKDLKREVPEIKAAIDLHEKEIRWLTGKRIAQEAIEEAERQNYRGENRRHGYRRDRDIVNDALARSDEHQYPEG